MRVQRFSAIEQFGVPIDDTTALSSARGLVGLMSSYDVDGTEVLDDLTEITPPYWTKNKFKYYLSRRGTDGPAVVELLPIDADSRTYLLLGMTAVGDIYSETHIRRFEIPTAQPAFPIIGPSPRYAGMLCVHELIADIDA